MIEITLTFLDGKRRGAVERFSTSPLRLGRADECEVRFDADQDLKVSAKHAELRTRGEALELEDLGSKNGTFVNGVAADGPTPLPNHAVVQLGKDGPRVKVAFAVDRSSPSAVSFGAMRKQAQKPAAQKRLATTDQTPTYDEADLVPPRRTSGTTLVLAAILAVLAVGAAASFALR